MEGGQKRRFLKPTRVKKTTTEEHADTMKTHHFIQDGISVRVNKHKVLSLARGDQSTHTHTAYVTRRSVQSADSIIVCTLPLTLHFTPWLAASHTHTHTMWSNSGNMTQASLWESEPETSPLPYNKTPEICLSNARTIKAWEKKRW